MSVDIRFENFDEFVRRLQDVGREFPKTTEKYLRRTGNKLKSEAKKNSPVGKSENRITRNGKSRVNKRKLKNSWTSQVKFDTLTQEYRLRSRAPHYHLVERGHNLIVRGRDKGHRPGKRFFQRTAENFSSGGELRRQMESFMNEIRSKIEG